MAARGPAALRGVVMGLHWTAAIVVVAWLAGVIPAWLLALHAGAWAAVTLAFGLRGGPSPALRGAARRAAHLVQPALLALYAAGAALALAGVPVGRTLLLVTIGAAALHGVFNAWRASILGDGAFRRMLPKALL